MNATETKTIPSIAEVRSALAAAEAGWVNIILLKQNDALRTDAVERFVKANPGTKLAELAQQLTRARREFNEVLETCCKEAQQRATELSQALARELFGQAIPGPVTLPLEDSGKAVTFIVKSLGSINGEGDSVGGYVNVTDASGRCGSSERFYMKNGTARFARPDIY